VLVLLLSAAAWGQNNRVARLVPNDLTPLPSAEVLQDVEIDPALERLVEQLDDPAYQKRQEATVALRDAPWENLELYAVLERLPLSAEQRHRVLLVIAERLLTRPRGAVGIQIDQRRLPEVVIFKLLPELPARDVLEIGDRITHLDGVPVQNWDRFRWAVQSRVPGTRISIRIERDVKEPPAEDDAAVDEVEVLDVELVLGSADLLVDPTTGRPQSDGAFLDARRQEALMASERYAPHRIVEVEKEGTEARRHEGTQEGS
jgi:C-terminal processing protease CtpA/Prc